ncbi:AmmeMemoRadiSam system protein A [Thiohalocapsa marina]|uniref:AmmeMemoRadiSam system protein A n=1 Tax=Thiohalocapsa marina TaxID=424902 RepID=A0A5M8FH40_9GAMM|nr:AmmeMemoRadiSam system protein A [Thiohalocapsa marina]KAA6182401.1 AmmeMemoRadiSam system protein A [Thiohalocapsa marina]
MSTGTTNAADNNGQPHPPDTDGAELAPPERRALLQLARASIRHGLDQGTPLTVSATDQPAALRAERAAFVTLQQQGRLRGCIGHLQAVQPLALDVAENAYAAAFNDPRFPPLDAAEFDTLHIAISVLTPAAPIAFGSEAELLAQLRPGIDGVILAWDDTPGAPRGTFLPSVWEQLPDPRDFLRHLKQKAGLPPEHWSDRLCAWRYRTETFSE